MSLKRFNADLRSVRTRLSTNGIPGVDSVERGDSDGEVVFTFVHDKLSEPLPVRLLSQNPDAYPDDHSFLLFTDAEDAPPELVKALGDLQNYTFGQNIFDSLRDVSSGLTRALKLVYYEPEEDDEYEDDDIFGLNVSQGDSSGHGDGHKTSSATLAKIKRDLRQARSAGVKVGILHGVNDQARTHTLSLSVRASKLGISDETLEAWDVDPSEYIVLLLRVNEPYAAAYKMEQHGAAFFAVDFRFGKCSRYKPDPKLAWKAFGSQSQHSGAAATAPHRDAEGPAVQKLFISNSLEQFMKENFMSLFSLRLSGCTSWDDAHTRYTEINNRHRPANATQETASRTTSGTDYRTTTPALLLVDAFDKPIEDISLPLVAMQFATHYFVRCTDYCLRCHRRLSKDFEALKPFVCSDPLCLFQYMAMGLGPSIEHEVMTQPYVVDLLVSLCYSSIEQPSYLLGYTPTLPSSYPIRDFPTGLRLKVPEAVIGAGEPFVEPLRVSVDMRETTGPKLVMLHKAADFVRVSAEKWIVLEQPTPAGGILHHASITSVDFLGNTLEVEFRYSHQMLPETPGHLKPTSDPGEMTLSWYETEFDDLDLHGKAKAMLWLLRTLPPIAHLREYLELNPLATLRNCPDITPAALTLLKWIVASNRSCILQIRDQEAIPSMRAGHVQFRFAQGTPDKELRFHRALKEQESHEYPTLFAWHGSNLGSWHSILRHGLDFKNVIHGRAYGDGVYFSQQYATSMSYMRSAQSWPNSALCATGAIALCEIINRPDQFVNTIPHLVVSQVDWIQCRYLFVTVGSNVMPPSLGAERIVEIAQDPTRKVWGPDDEVLKIPAKALPSSRGALSHKEKLSKPSPSKRNHNTFNGAADTDQEDNSDLEALLSEEERLHPPYKRANPKVSRDSSVDTDTVTALQLTAKRPLTPPSTDFRPGTLDLSTMPRLALPEWADANATRRLATDIKQMQKIQASTPLHELGWYIDFENVENMFQWIVELHSFDPKLPLAKDMKAAGVTSVVLEVRFGRDYPFSPPFVRVVRPQFLPFMNGGGGHVTLGGAICMELLTSNGWLPATTMDSVFLSIKMAISSTEPRPARLNSSATADYHPTHALEAFQRAAARHGWTVPNDSLENAQQPFAQP
ncbi:hypothetical protein M406DRAFT_38809 [Cryphonectria parasitica EP155]|uniref:UBC core domain-containing protein n=1 Tax=Cryphonectria parasitica (strain ATCC 38755 / EP155) TaxID=660469 RepID=A0A9P4Y4L2_CRYP1|nr:uncharacterized protein M406DRAFT_38809 [Cryphonectria parasitica EP155]KAF3766546.1 hypothetical protein M406DRAFT_38809 [Cryphonectria parasitica EP155]